MSRLRFLLLAVTLCGCQARTEIEPLREAVAALASDVQRVDNRIGDIKARVSRVDQSVNNYDTWTLRFQSVAPWLLLALPLPYILGKGIWNFSARVVGVAKSGRERSERRNGKSQASRRMR